MSGSAAGDVYRYSPFKGATFQVHAALGDSANDLNGDEIWARQEWIAQKARVSRKATNEALAELVAAGFLVVLEDNSAHRKPNRYRLTVPSEAAVIWDKAGLLRKPNMSPGVTSTCNERLHDMSPGVTQNPREPKKNPTSASTKVERGKSPERIEADAIVKAWWDWAKEKTGNPPTAQNYIGVVKIIERLLKAGFTKSEIKRALIDCPTVSIGWMESTIKKQREQSPTRLPVELADSDDDPMPDWRNVSAYEAWQDRQAAKDA